MGKEIETPYDIASFNTMGTRLDAFAMQNTATYL
jgi:hypothetical protein